MTNSVGVLKKPFQLRVLEYFNISFYAIFDIT